MGIEALKNLVANIEAGNCEIDSFDGYNLNDETAEFYLKVTVPEGKELDIKL